MMSNPNRLPSATAWRIETGPKARGGVFRMPYILSQPMLASDIDGGADCEVPPASVLGTPRRHRGVTAAEVGCPYGSPGRGGLRFRRDRARQRNARVRVPPSDLRALRRAADDRGLV